jgi:hypothetical protein
MLLIIYLVNKLENLKFCENSLLEDKFAHIEYVESQTGEKILPNLLNSLSTVVDLKI